MKPNLRTLGVYLVGVFVGALDSSVLGPVLPAIARGLHVDLTWTAWTITAYTVAYVAVTVLAGAAGDRYGRNRLFRAGMVAFGAASVLAALAHSFPVFVLARALQGAGAGAVYPNAQAAGVAQFPAERRGLALGLFGAVFGLASIIGPNVGGALGQYVGWPAIFAVNVPIALLVLVLGRRLPPDVSRSRTVPDWLGGLCFGGLLAAVLLLLSVGGAAPRLALAAAAALLLVGFLRRQRRAATPFLDTEPLSDRAGVAFMLAAALIGLDLSAAVWVPSLAQQELHLGVLASGVALMPAALSGAVLAGAAGVLVDRIGPRTVLQVGLAAAVVGGVLLALPHVGWADFVLAMLAFGLATAFTVGAPVNRVALGLYRDEQAGEALALVAVFRAVGLAAGPVLLVLAESWHGFSGMFGAVAAASLLGLLLFGLVPDVRPAAAGLGRRAGQAKGA